MAGGSEHNIGSLRCCEYVTIPGRESRGENDDVQGNADDVDGKAEEDGVLVIMVNDAPEEREEKEQVVY